MKRFDSLIKDFHSKYLVLFVSFMELKDLLSFVCIDSVDFIRDFDYLMSTYGV